VPNSSGQLQADNMTLCESDSHVIDLEFVRDLDDGGSTIGSLVGLLTAASVLVYFFLLR
jgi:hypothetical protein